MVKARVPLAIILSAAFVWGASVPTRAGVGLAPATGDQREYQGGTDSPPVEVKPADKDQPVLQKKETQPPAPTEIRRKPAVKVKAKILCQGKPATIVAKPEGGILKGTPGPDIIAGLGGADQIDGMGGDDVICGGGGDDVIRGGPGNDILMGEEGRDRLYGGSGNDELFGGSGRDILDGETGDDILIGGGGLDTCTNPGNYADKKTGCETYTSEEGLGRKFGKKKDTEPQVIGFGSKVKRKPGDVQVLGSKVAIGKDVGDPQVLPSKKKFGKGIGDPQVISPKVEVGKDVGDPQVLPGEVEVGKGVGDPQVLSPKFEAGKGVGDPEVTPAKVEVGEGSDGAHIVPPGLQAGKASDGEKVIAPQITSVLPVPAGPHKFIDTALVGDLRPGFHLHVLGKNFGSRPGKVLMCGDLPGGCVELEDLQWKSNTLLQGVVPMATNGRPNQEVKLRVVLPAAPGSMFNVNVSNDHPAIFTGREQKPLAMEAVAIVSCGKDSNYTTCNGENWSGSAMGYGRYFGPGCPDCSIFGWHRNKTAAVGDDVGDDHYSVSLRNGWVFKELSISTKKTSSDEVVDPPNPPFPYGQSEWSPVIHWEVTPNDEISYEYRIEVEGPLGTHYK